MANQMIGLRASKPFSGNVTVTHVFPNLMNGFCISNDDATADLTFTIGTDTFTVKAKETFHDYFEPFTTVVITTAIAYRAYGLC